MQTIPENLIVELPRVSLPKKCKLWCCELSSEAITFFYLMSVFGIADIGFVLIMIGMEIRNLALLISYPFGMFLLEFIIVIITFKIVSLL
jgi:hypothetical protein